MAAESLKINELAMARSYDIIIKALKTQKGFKIADKDLKKILYHLKKLFSFQNLMKKTCP